MLYRDINGTWKGKNIPKKFNLIYTQSLIKYFNCLDPLFTKAQSKSDFEFILTLLSIRGHQDAGWDSFETTQDIFNVIHKLKKKIKYNDEQLHIFLLLYGLIVEASFPYELIANLLNIIADSRYQLNFPDKKTGTHLTPQYPSEKIEKIKHKAGELGLEKNVQPLTEVFNRELRNAIFHSDYSIYKNELRLPRVSQVYKIEDINALINKALAYHETIIWLVKIYKASNQEPKVIDVHPEFSKDPEEKAVVMVRKGTGVIGIKDNWTKEQIEAGRIPFRLCRSLPYEQKILDDNPFIALLPPNKIAKINRVLKSFPNFIRRPIFKILEKFL